MAVCLLAVIALLVVNKPGKKMDDLAQVGAPASSVAFASTSGAAPASPTSATTDPGLTAQAADNLDATASSSAADRENVGEEGNTSGGAEYILEVDPDSGEVNVAVVSGQVTLVDATGTEKQVSQGQQTQFPSGESSTYDLAGDDGGATGGIPLRQVLVDNELPAAYDIYEPFFADDQIPADWVLEDPKQDTLIKTPDPSSVVLTVPDGNDLWSDRADAPRLLHRATGDFDLQGEMLLQTKATNLVYAQFALKAPGTMIGALKDQMGGGTGVADYLLLPSSWYAADGQNRIGCLIWEERVCPEGPTDFLHVRLTRRGDVFTTYTSLDGEHWNLHSQQTLALPETLWAGWLVKRMAYDNLTEEPAVVTLRNIRLDTGPRHWLPWPEWDFDQLDGSVEVQGNQITLNMDGTKLGQVYATQGEPIEGDFDVIAAYETDAWKGEAGKRPGLGLTITDLDRSKGSEAYQRRVYVNALQAEDGKTPPFIGTDLKGGNQWQQYDKAKFTPGSQGKFRIIRQGEVMSTYALDGTKWVRLDRFNGGGFSEPATIWLYVWNGETNDAAAFTTTFTLEQIATGDRVTETVKSLTGIVAAAPAAVPSAAAPTSASGVLFEDDFASKQASEAKGWTFKSLGQIDYTWSSNQLITSSKKDGGLLRGFAKGDYDDIGLEAEAQFVSSAAAGAGLEFRYSEANSERSFYEFAITTNGEYYLSRTGPGISTDLVGLTPSSLIKPAPSRNMLGVLVIGSSISLYINRTLVQTVTDTMIPAKGKAGLTAYLDSAQASVAFSRFTVYTPDQAKKAWSAAAAPAAGATTEGRAPDAAAIAQEEAALAAPPGYIRYVHSGADFSVNIPDFWQSLAEDAKGRQIVLGSMGSKTNLQIGMSAAGQDLDEVINKWVQEMNGQVVIPASTTAVGHYAARQMVVDVSEPTSRRIYLAAVSTPDRTFTLAVDGPAAESLLDDIFGVVVSSFRAPARCGEVVCPELLQQDAAVGTPASAPAVAPEVTPVGGGAFSAFTFAAGSTKDYEPVDPRTNFPEGVTSVFAVYTYEGMKKGTPFVWHWYLNGTEYLKGTPATWDSDESGGGWRRLYNPEGLPAGSYELRLYISDQLRQKDTFTVEERPAGMPSFGRILFAENIKDGQPVNLHQPKENFKAGTQRVYAFFDASNMTKGLAYRREWYRDGALMITQPEPWDWGATEKNWWAQYYNEKGLASGTYELKLFVEDELVQLATFVIE